MSSDKVVVVKDLHKHFRLPNEQYSGIKQKIINLASNKSNKGYENQHVLKGISFDVERGDFFGIVGRNGSGKSTLLKLLAGIYQPDSGSVAVDGSLIPFIELGVGFNPELTGRENVFLNGALLGFSHSEMQAMYSDIVQFAELENFMDQKLKNYSSGMQVRLAFSIAIKAEGDILLLDEVLAVGDEAFQRKCDAFFEKIKKDKTKTVILVTHSMESVKKYCNKAMMIQDGQIIEFGNPEKVADEYYGHNLMHKDTRNSTDEPGDDDKKRKPSFSAKVVSKRTLTPQDKLEVDITYTALDDSPVFPKAYIDLDGYAMMATNPKQLKWTELITADVKKHTVRYTLPLKDFNKGEYKVIALLEDESTGVNIANYGYEGEMIIKINNEKTQNRGGVFSNQASMEKLK